jgi:type VI protein secretion system component Hcp
MPIYMNVTGKDGNPVVTGDVTAGDHSGWIELQSANLGVSRTAPSYLGTESASRGDSTPTEVVVTKFRDSASPGLYQMYATSPADITVTIDFVGDATDQAPYRSIALEAVVVSDYSVSGKGNRPLETASLNFTTVSYTGKPTSSQVSSQTVGDNANWDWATCRLGDDDSGE